MRHYYDGSDYDREDCGITFADPRRTEQPESSQQAQPA